MRYLTIEEVIELHARVLDQTGGAGGIRSRDALESSIGQPFQAFGGEDLYPSLVAKAAALGFFLVRNHPFIDGNKRIGHAALEVTLVLNGMELTASVDEQEEMFLALAAGTVPREEFTAWVERSVRRSA